MASPILLSRQKQLLAFLKALGESVSSRELDDESEQTETVEMERLHVSALFLAGSLHGVLVASH